MNGTDSKLAQLGIALGSALRELDSARATVAKAGDAYAQALSDLSAFELALEASQLRRTKELESLRSLQRSNAKRLPVIDAQIVEKEAAEKHERMHAHAAWVRNDHAKRRTRNDAARRIGNALRVLQNERQRRQDDERAQQRAFSAVTLEIDGLLRDIATIGNEILALQQELALAEFYASEALRTRRRAGHAYSRRLLILRREFDEFQESWPSIAATAGVPEAYLSDTKIKVDEKGETNIYFGGEGGPTGRGHAHYVLLPDGTLNYAREIGAPHGPQNFIAHPLNPSRVA